MKYHIVQLGCQMNISDGERVRQMLENMGFVRTENEEEASLLGLIACSVRQKAIDKVYTRIHKWNKWKNRKNLITFVSGCLLPADRERFLKMFDLVFPMSELPRFPDMIKQYGIVTPAGLQSLGKGLEHREPMLQERSRHKESILKPYLLQAEKPEKNNLRPDLGIEEFWHISAKYGSGFEAYIPIQNGCNKFCTFCAVPYTRGREVSRPSDEIMTELINLVNKGYKTITLLGQNVNSYGKDKKEEEVSFSELLEKIGQYGDESGKDFWVYFTSPHPRDMGDEVIEVISRYNCLAKQIHLPIQSGDDGMLIRMNRKHSVEKYREIIHSIRKMIPEATVFTDIIVGFTGETEEEFENTRRIMTEFKYNMAYIAQYSPRPGAVSSRWTDDVPKAVKKERYHILTGDLMKHSLENNRKLIAKTVNVLVRGKDRKTGYLSAISEGKIIVRFKSDDESLVGEFVHVKINSAVPFSTEGEMVSKEKMASGVDA